MIIFCFLCYQMKHCFFNRLSLAVKTNIVIVAKGSVVFFGDGCHGGPCVKIRHVAYHFPSLRKPTQEVSFASFACKHESSFSESHWLNVNLTNYIQGNLPQDWQKGKRQFPEICFPKSKFVFLHIHWPWRTIVQSRLGGQMTVDFCLRKIFE